MTQSPLSLFASVDPLSRIINISLATMSLLKLPLSSSTNSGKSEKRRFFSKNKDKGKVTQSPEALDSWEELSADDTSTDDASETQAPSLMSVVAACQCGSPAATASPTRSVSFTYGTQQRKGPGFYCNTGSVTVPAFASGLSSIAPCPCPSTTTTSAAASSSRKSRNSVHPLSLLDRKVPFVHRPARKKHTPTPPRIQVPIPVPLDPVVTTVRTRLPQNVPQPPPAVHSGIPRNSVTAQVVRPSPLSQDTFSPSPPPPEAPLDSSFWKAVDTPLPSTPVKAAHTIPPCPSPSSPCPCPSPLLLLLPLPPFTQI
ncbi:hypothetical protein NMY22_g17144 [Coprinellus aureogranulatus]|nr:hypothetical protein NMY22_g17144 [Coprinellus aureogranulatus]